MIYDIRDKMGHKSYTFRSFGLTNKNIFNLYSLLKNICHSIWDTISQHFKNGRINIMIICNVKIFNYANGFTLIYIRAADSLCFNGAKMSSIILVYYFNGTFIF